MITYDNCGAKYTVTEYHSPMRDKDNLKCCYCQNILSEWNGSIIYVYKEISGPTKESALKKRIETLRNRGLYKHYGSIIKLAAEMKKIQGKVSSLEMKESMAGDAEIQEKINLLSNGFHFWFDLAVFET